MALQDEAIFFYSDWGILKEIKAKMPEAYLMPRLYKASQVRKTYRKLDPVIGHIDPSFNNAKTKSEAQKYGLRTWINSLGSVDEELRVNPDSPLAHELIENGVSLVQTDLPEIWIRIKNGKDTTGLK